MGISLPWNSVYPGVVDSVAVNFPVVTNAIHDVLATHVNEMASAIVALEIGLGGFRTNNVRDPLSPAEGDMLQFDAVAGDWEAGSPFARRVIPNGLSLTVPDEYQHLVHGSISIVAGGSLTAAVGGEIVII